MTGILQSLLGSVSSAAAVATDAFFNLVTLLLPGNGTNGAQNNTFLDSSTNNFTITRNGNTTQGTFSPFSQTGWSNYFDGSSVLSNTTTTSTGFNLSTGSFTIEAWVYVTAITAYQYVVSLANTAGNDSGLVFGLDNTGKPYIGNGVVLGKSGSTAISANSWTHIAVVGDGTNIQFYTNGTANGSAQAFNPNTAQYFYVGRSAAGSNALTGYISNVRVTKGQQLYTGAFTPSTSALTTTSQGATATNVHLLTCQSNRFVDNGTNTFAIAVTGSPSVQAFSPFAPTAAYSAATVGGSGFFDGSGDNLSTPSITIGTNTFCFECWLYPTVSQGTAATIFAGSNNSSLQLSFFGNSLGIAERGVAWQVTGTATVPIAAWSHVAFVRSGTGTNQTSIYLNGTRIANGTVSLSYVASIYQFSGTNGGGAEYQGYMSGVRFSNGSTPYDATQSTITIPTAPPSPTGSTLCLQFTNAGITDATAKNVLETVGNAQISTTQSKFGGSSMYFDGTGDYLLMPDTPDLELESGNFTIEAWVYLTALNTERSIVGKIASQAVCGAYLLEVDSSNVIKFYSSNNTSSWQILGLGTATISQNTWTHVAVTRSGNTFTVWVNGTSSGTTTASFTLMNQTVRTSVGAFENGALPWLGYIDDLRITKGYARYTTNFTPPTAAFPLR